MCCLISASLFSQNKQLLYGFSEIPQSLLQNPGGIVKNKGYVGIPLLSHIHFHAGSSGATVYDLFADNGIDFNAKLRKAVYSMDKNDFFTLNEQTEIFSGGFAYGNRFEKDKYISFGLYQEFDMIAYFPEDYSILALEGNYNNLGRVFNAGDFNASAELISVLHVGINKKVTDDLTIGFRGKIYSSIMNISSTKNKGSFYTLEGQNNFFDHYFNLDLEVRTSGIASLTSDDALESSEITDAFKKRVLLGGNLGLGFDIGFTKQINKQLTIDASLLDIGFISHKKDVETYKVKGDLIFEGVNPIFPETETNQTADEYWSDIEDDFEDLFQPDTVNTKYTTWRPIKLNASVNYAFGKKKETECNCLKEDVGYLNAVGGQLFLINRPKQPQLAITTYYYRRVFNGLQAKISYTLDSYSFYNLGLGISANLKGFNMYVMADNFFQYNNVYNAQSVSLQIGLNYIFKNNED